MNTPTLDKPRVMSEKEKRTCALEQCLNTFEPTKHSHRFCSRACFKKYYYLKKKEQERNDPRKKTPSYTCPFCGQVSELSFDPSKYTGAFNKYMCPFCKISREYLWLWRGEIQKEIRTVTYAEEGRVFSKTIVY